MKVGKML